MPLKFESKATAALHVLTKMGYFSQPPDVPPRSSARSASLASCSEPGVHCWHIIVVWRGRGLCGVHCKI